MGQSIPIFREALFRNPRGVKGVHIHLSKEEVLSVGQGESGHNRAIDSLR